MTQTGVQCASKTGFVFVNNHSTSKKIILCQLTVDLSLMHVALYWTVVSPQAAWVTQASAWSTMCTHPTQDEGQLPKGLINHDGDNMKPMGTT